MSSFIFASIGWTREVRVNSSLFSVNWCKSHLIAKSLLIQFQLTISGVSVCSQSTVDDEVARRCLTANKDIETVETRWSEWKADDTATACGWQPWRNVNSSRRTGESQRHADSAEQGGSIDFSGNLPSGSFVSSQSDYPHSTLWILCWRNPLQTPLSLSFRCTMRSAANAAAFVSLSSAHFFRLGQSTAINRWIPWNRLLTFAFDGSKTPTIKGGLFFFNRKMSPVDHGPVPGGKR